MGLFAVGLLIWAGAIWVGGYVAGQKGRPQNEGWMLGFILGPIGALIVALLPDGDPATWSGVEPAGDFEEDDEPVADLASLGLVAPEPEKPKAKPGAGPGVDPLFEEIRRAADARPEKGPPRAG